MNIYPMIVERLRLVARGFLDIEKLRLRYHDTPMDEKTMFRAGRSLSLLGD
jgi:hypothetical protein